MKPPLNTADREHPGIVQTPEHEVPPEKFDPLNTVLSVFIERMREQVSIFTRIRELLGWISEEEWKLEKSIQQTAINLDCNVTREGIGRALRVLLEGANEKRGTINWQQTENQAFIENGISECITINNAGVAIDHYKVFAFAAKLKKLIDTSGQTINATPEFSMGQRTPVDKVFADIEKRQETALHDYDTRLHTATETPYFFRFYSAKEFERYILIRRLERQVANTQVALLAVRTIKEYLKNPHERMCSKFLDFWGWVDIESAILGCITVKADGTAVINDGKLATLIENCKTLFEESTTL